MSARYFLTCLAGALLVAAILLNLGAAAPSPTAFAAPDAATAASVQPPEVTPAPAAPPAVPAPTIDDARRLWQRGEMWAAGVVALFIAMSALHRLDPSRAWFYTAGATLLGGTVALITAGVMPTASMAIGIVAGLVGTALRGPGLQRPRDPQRGSAMLPLLACVSIVLGAGAAWSCSATGRAARSVASDVVDCTTATARAHAAEYGGLVEQLIRSATAPSGEVDVAPLKAAAMGLGLETGGCAIATVFARLMRAEPQPIGLVATPEPAPASLRRGFEALRADVFAGARFRVELGGL